MLRRTLIVAAIVSLIGAASAMGGVHRIDQRYCSDPYPQIDQNGVIRYYVACTTIRGTEQDVRTPSGNAMHSFKGSYENTLYIDGVLYAPATFVQDINFTTHTLDELAHVVASHVTYTFTANGQTCVQTVDAHYNYDKQEFQFNRSSFSCS